MAFSRLSRWDGGRRVHGNVVLGICCMSLLIVGMDATIVNVALPAVQRDLRADVTGLQWIVDAYTLVVASFLMLAGSLSDRFGRRAVFQFGLLLFTLGSVCCSLGSQHRAACRLPCAAGTWGFDVEPGGALDHRECIP